MKFNRSSKRLSILLGLSLAAFVFGTFAQPSAQAQAQGKMTHVGDKHKVDVELQNDVGEESDFEIKLWILPEKGDSSSGKLTFAPLEPATDTQVTVDDPKPKIKAGKKATVTLDIKEGARGQQIVVEITGVKGTDAGAHGHAIVAVSRFDRMPPPPKKGKKAAESKSSEPGGIKPVNTPIGIGGR